jgi:hypothetical protein
MTSQHRMTVPEPDAVTNAAPKRDGRVLSRRIPGSPHHRPASRCGSCSRTIRSKASVRLPAHPGPATFSTTQSLRGTSEPGMAM